MIRTATPADLPALRELERAAGEGFRDIGMHAVADDEPPSIEELAAFQQAGRAFILPDAYDQPAGYLLVEPVDGYAHITQVSVHPNHARRGLGRQLIEAADRWAATNDLAALTLTSYAHVPWNAPYYARLGLRALADDELPRGLRAVREHETARGLDAWPRVTMRRRRTTAVRVADHPRVRLDQHVRAPLARVWQVITDITVPARYSPELQRVEWLDGADSPRLGAVFAGYNRNPVIGDWRTHSHVVEFAPQQAFGWAVVDPDGRFGGTPDPRRPVATWRFTLEPEGAGTRVAHSAQIGTARSGLTLAIERAPEREEHIVAGRLIALRDGIQATLDGITALADPTG